MKRKTLFSLVTFFYCLSAFGQNTFIKEKSTAQVPLLKFIEYAYPKLEKLSSEEKQTQPFSNEDKTLAFVKHVLQNGKDYGLSVSMTNSWEGKAMNLEKSDAAIVFVYQPFDLKQLLGGTNDERQEIAKKYKETCVKVNEAVQFILDGQTDLENTYKLSKDKDFTDKDGKVAAQVASLQLLLKIKEDYIRKNQAVLDSLKNLYEIKKNKFAFVNSVSNHVLNKEDADWSTYLIDKRNVLIVLIGDKEVLGKSNIKVDLKATEFQTDLSDLLNFAASVSVKVPTDLKDFLRAGEGCELTFEPSKESVAVTFIELTPKKLRTPYTMTVTTPLPNSDIQVDVKERIYFGLRVGVGVSNLDRKIFTLDSSNALTVTLDSTKKSEWKGNATAIFEFIPWGRDVARLQPIWKKNQETPVLERFGFFGGVKISNDPLEQLLLGFSFAITKEFSITLGGAFNATPIDQKKLPVGIDATLDYLKETAQREYKMNFHAGLMMSPGQLVKAIKSN